MKKNLFLLILLASIFISMMAKPVTRVIMTGAELEGLDIAELPGVGMCINLDGDSLIYLDDPELPILHLPSKSDTRQIIVCDTTIYGSVGAGVYANADTIPVIILDNESFSLYPASGSTFYVCTADSLNSSLILVDPLSGAYSYVSEIDAPIYKVVANDQHTLALLDNEIVAVGANNEMATLFEGQGINDMALSPMGLFIATDSGLYLTSHLSELELWTSRKCLRVWWINKSLYVLDSSGTLVAIDNLIE